MSSNQFPTLPTLDIAATREAIYKVTTKESVSGREDRTNWASEPRYRYKVKHNGLRDNVYCTTVPWTAYSEIGVVQKFLEDHYANFDSFLFEDPYDGVVRRVRFVDNSVTVTRVVSNLWAVEFALISVI
jgi:hypothetical protein